MHARNQPRLLLLEVQRFSQWWLWLLLAGISGFQAWILVQQLILKRPFGNHPASDTATLAICLATGLGLPLLLLSCRLVTAVQSDALYVRYFPFHLRPVRIAYQQIKSCAAVRYRPLADYGGWGIRFGKPGKAYNVTGDLGVAIVFTSGEQLLIGSRRPEAVVQAVLAAQQAAR
jgi:hypothetical protein